MKMRLMYNQNCYNTHEAYRHLTYFMHRWGPNMDTNYLVRQVEHQFKLFYNSRRKDDFVSFCEWRLVIENLKQKAPEFRAWERDEAEEQIAQDATNRAERIHQWREHVNWKYDIFAQQFRNPEDYRLRGLLNGETHDSLKAKVQRIEELRLYDLLNKRAPHLSWREYLSLMSVRMCYSIFGEAGL